MNCMRVSPCSEVRFLVLVESLGHWSKLCRCFQQLDVVNNTQITPVMLISRICVLSYMKPVRCEKTGVFLFMLQVVDLPQVNTVHLVWCLLSSQISHCSINFWLLTLPISSWGNCKNFASPMTTLLWVDSKMLSLWQSTFQIVSAFTFLHIKKQTKNTPNKWSRKR